MIMISNNIWEAGNDDLLLFVFTCFLKFLYKVLSKNIDIYNKKSIKAFLSGRPVKEML